MRPTASFPLGAAITVDELERDPHPALARLRASEPVSWIPALGGWLVTRHDLALVVLRDDRRFTVDDPRFSTAVVVGPSMLSLDGEDHDRHRTQFVPRFRPGEVRSRFAGFVAEEVERLIDRLAPAGGAELRRSFAGALAAATMASALGLDGSEVGDLLAWYDEIVAGVSAITAGRPAPAAARDAFAALGTRLQMVMRDGDRGSLLAGVAASGALSPDQIVSNAAVLLFGGIETTEGMIANALLEVLKQPNLVTRIREHPELLDAAVDESLRLEPAAAILDRYATVDARLDGVAIASGDLVRVSIAGANRDPAVFARPDRFDLDRPHPRRHLAFAQGPHVCLGVHLARLEARSALAAWLARFSRLRLEPERPAEARGLVFRKPPELYVRWD